jgi:hypothetical protein
VKQSEELIERFGSFQRKFKAKTISEKAELGNVTIEV